MSIKPSYNRFSLTKNIQKSTADSVPNLQSKQESSSFSLSPKAPVQEPQSSALSSAQCSTSLQSVLDQPPSSLPWKLAVGGLVFCVAFGTWASFGQIDEVGHARGQLVPKGEIYKINPIEIGKVVNIAVKEGQAVEAGEVLVELDPQIAASEVERLQQQLIANQTQLNQKQNLLEKSRLEASTRTEIAEAEAEAAAAGITQAQAKVTTLQKQLTQFQADEIASQTRLERLKPLSAQSEELMVQRQADADAALERLKRLKPLLESGAIAKEQLYQAEQAVRDRQSAITKNQLEESTGIKEQLFSAEQTLRDRQRTIVESQGELQQMLAQAEQLHAGLAQKQAEGRKTQIEAQQQIQQLEVEITQLKATIAETKTLLESAEAKLKQRFLYAPVNGVVSSLNVHNIGEVVQPGQMIAEMAAKNAPLMLSAVLPTQEAGFIKTGMSVQIKFDAYPYQDFGIVSGKVASISPDAKPDEQLGTVYRVEVALDRHSVKVEHQTIPFKAGQTATADIIIRRRRIIDILLDPIRQLEKGGLNL